MFFDNFSILFGWFDVRSWNLFVTKNTFLFRCFFVVYPSNMAPIATKLRQNAFRTICNFQFFFAKKFFFRKKIEKFSVSDDRFSWFSADFGGASLFLTSKSCSWRYFASDAPILRSVRSKIVKNEPTWGPNGPKKGHGPHRRTDERCNFWALGLP